MKRFGWFAAFAAMAALLVGCGSSSGGSSSDSSNSGTPAASTSEGGATAGFDAEVKTDVAAAEAPQKEKPPTSGPPIQKGKNVVLIPCGAQFEGCNNPIEAGKEAAEKVGWHVRVIDPAGDPTKYASSIRQAIASGADGIMLGAIDADVASAAIKEADEAGIAVVIDLGVDPEGIAGAIYPEESVWREGGYALGAALYQANGDSGKFGFITAQEFGGVRLEQKGTEEFIEKCEAAGGDCENVVVENLTTSTVESDGAQTATNMLRSHPEINSFWSDADAATQIFAPAVESAGLSKDSILGSLNANAANLNAIAKGGVWQKYDAGNSEVWLGYACIDALNRIFAGQKPVDEGIRMKLFSEKNAPASGPWEGDVDVPALYEKLWGIS
jgi:ribose transport system substrate-binding protein